MLVPASPGRGRDGRRRWYDSGIGFAVPLEDVIAVLPRLKEGQGPPPRAARHHAAGHRHVQRPRRSIGAIQPDSAAAKAGMKAGDKILEIDGKPIPNYSTLQHVLGPQYEGDEVTVKVTRGDKEQEFKDVKLLGTSTAYVNAFLGILPMRDDPGPGVEVRYVYPKSPADAAGLKAGDRIMKLGPANVSAAAAADPEPRRAHRRAAAAHARAPRSRSRSKRKEKDGEKEVEKTSR